MRSIRLGRSVKAGAIILAVLTWIAIPVAGLIVVSQQVSQQAVVAEEPTLVPVESSTAATSLDAALRLSWQQSPDLLSPGFSGTVEEILFNPGQPLKNGDAVVRVGGIARLAISSGRPFTTPQSLGSTGFETEQLNRVLGDLGYASASGRLFTRDTERGVEQLSIDLGASSRSGVFDATWFIYLGSPGAIVSTTDLQVGAPAGAAGESLLSFAPSLVDATLYDPNGVEIAGESGTDPSDGTDPNLDADEANPVPLPGPVQPLTAPAGAQLILGGISVQLAESRTAVLLEDLPTLQAVVEPLQTDFDATLSVPAEPGQLELPSAAIWTARDGVRNCVTVQDESGAVGVEVTVVGGAFSRSVIEGQLRPGDLVEIDPPTERRTC